jgi:hypothetical protein
MSPLEAPFEGPLLEPRVFTKEKGANLLTLHYRHVDAFKETLSARPEWGALQTLSLNRNFHVS